MLQQEFMFFLTGGVGLENKMSNPASAWLSDKNWDEICRLNDIACSPVFRGLRYDIKRLCCKPHCNFNYNVIYAAFSRHRCNAL